MRSTPNIVLAPFAAIFLVLCVVAAVSRPVSTGLPIILPAISTSGMCGDGYLAIAQVGRNSITLRVNGELKGEPEVDVTLQQFYSAKIERVLFVAADAGVQYDKVIRFIDRANGVVDHLVISLLTPSAEREVCLGVRMPDRPFAPWLKYYKEHGTFPSQ